MAPRTKHRAHSRRASIGSVIVGLIGELLITAGVIVGLFLVWQLWWTGIDANKLAAEHKHAFEKIQVASPRVEGVPRYDDPPEGAPVAYGQTIGMLIVPKWYGLTNNNMPIQEGTGADILDEAAAGHYPETQQIGQIGNFALAGHRRTNGNSFRRIDVLTPGDEIIVATTDTWYVYKVTDYQIVSPEQVEAIAPVPGQPDVAPTARYLTLTTCHSLTTGEWGNDHRWIVHAVFSYWMPRAEGRPASVLNDPEVN